MSKNGSSGALASFSFDYASPVPIYKQICREMRQAIICGRLRGGARLPASRVLANELGVSRNTIISVFDSLISEGYIESRVGDGTYVARVLPEEHLLPREAIKTICAASILEHNTLSSRGRMLAKASMSSRIAEPALPRPFCADLPAVDAFPTEAWGRLMTKCWHKITPNMLGHVDPAGYEPLQQAITQHLQAARFVRCSAEQIIVTSGSQQSLDLIARLLIDAGDAVWIEEPGYIGARGVFAAAGARLIPVPVDEAGLNIAAGRALEPNPKIIFVSPSRQYPLGMTLSAERRRELIEFSNRTGAWIVEDDYDNEFRYDGTPLPAMQSLVNADRVIYLGTFSKSLLPAFRLGYMVVPNGLAKSFVTAQTTITRHAPILEQMTLYEFMASGQFAAHIRKMRHIYFERQTTLVNLAARHLSDFVTVCPAETGMHVVGFFTREIDDIAFCDAAQRRGISLRPLSIYYLQNPKRSGLILGFAATPSSRIISGVERLAKFAAEFLGTDARVPALPPRPRLLPSAPMSYVGAAGRETGA
jgi:GntR family transcriptional regulator/MocR family aminotransferase